MRYGCNFLVLACLGVFLVNRAGYSQFPEDENLTPQQKKWIVEVKKGGATARIFNFPPEPNELPRPTNVRTHLDVESDQDLAPRLRKVLPLLLNLPGDHVLYIQALTWTEECLAELEVLRQVKSLRAIGIAYGKLPDGGEKRVHEVLKKITPASVNLEKLAGMDLARQLSIDPKADELQQLLVKRYNTAVDRMQVARTRHAAGKESPWFVHITYPDVVSSARALCKTPGEEMVWLERWQHEVRQLEESVAKDRQAGRPADRWAVLSIRDLRLSVEIEILRTRERLEKMP